VGFMNLKGPGQLLKDEERDQQAARARMWLKRQRHGSAVAWRPRKKQRVKAFQWLCSLNQQLSLATEGNVTLGSFKPTAADEAGSKHSWPYLSISADQGSDGVCAIGWLQRKVYACVDSVWDLSHLCSNAWKAGIRRSGMMAHQQLMVCCWNARHGPWQQGVRWGQACEAVEAHLKLFSPSQSPLFLEHVPDILCDKGQLHRLTEDGIEDSLWADIEDMLPWR
jgi:hypothetical protein